MPKCGATVFIHMNNFCSRILVGDIKHEGKMAHGVPFYQEVGQMV